jgi:hypothetical protein
VLIEDAVRLLLRLLLKSSRATLLGAGAAYLGVMAWASSWGLVLRTSASALAAVAVLLWQSGGRQAGVTAHQE